MWLGKKVRFVDIDSQTWLPESCPNNEKEDEGLISVVPFGGSLRNEEISRAGEHVIDAAASLPSRPQLGAKLPSNACAVFSLHATKTMGGAEGGVAVFGSRERAQRARALINFGFLGSRESFLPGINGKISEYDAAVVNARFDGWAREESRWEILRGHAQRVSMSLGIGKVPESMSSLNPYWIVLLPSEEARLQVVSALARAGIDSRLWWGTGLHKTPGFSIVDTGATKVVDDVASRYLGLPFFVGMDDRDFDKIEAVVSSALR
jgi:dTDP-4-amino-4,6-dideoxygalactose transaminase